MRKKTSPTIIEKAVDTINGFEKVLKTLHQQVALKGQSKSTLFNYSRRIAIISLHFGKLPQQISDDELNEYLKPWLWILNRLPEAVLNTWFMAFDIIFVILVITNVPSTCLR
jgi:hypothetical protein